MFIAIICLLILVLHANSANICQEDALIPLNSPNFQGICGSCLPRSHPLYNEYSWGAVCGLGKYCKAEIHPAEMITVTSCVDKPSNENCTIGLDCLEFDMDVCMEGRCVECIPGQRNMCKRNGRWAETRMEAFWDNPMKFSDVLLGLGEVALVAIGFGILIVSNCFLLFRKVKKKKLG